MSSLIGEDDWVDCSTLKEQTDRPVRSIKNGEESESCRNFLNQENKKAGSEWKEPGSLLHKFMISYNPDNFFPTTGRLSRL